VLHTDAVQALAWCEVDSMVAPFDLVSVSGHKIGAPKGVGALVVRGAAAGNLSTLLFGGPQERELRAGTENVPGIVAFGAAAAAAANERSATVARVRRLRDRFVDALAAQIPDVVETVPRDRRIVANAHLYFPGIDNEELLFVLDENGVAASAGSSCASGAVEPSHVLIAMGRSVEQARGSIRFSLGSTTTTEEVDWAVDSMARSHRQLAGGRHDAPASGSRADPTS
jgi:cysteine desulfurase